MFPAVSTLVVYAAAAALGLWLARRCVSPVTARAALALAAAPLLFTGRAIVTGGIVAPIDIAYQAEPLHAVAPAHGTAATRNPLLADVVAQMLPWRQAIRASLAAGRFPLWNPSVLSGAPLLGVAQPAPFHPATAIGLLLPPVEAWNFELSLRLLIALASAFLFFREIGAGPPAAFLGAFAWGFSDFLVLFVGYPMTASVAPFPLLLLGLRRLARGGGASGAGVVTASLVLTAVAGHPETLLFSVAAAGVFFLFELGGAPRGARLRPALVAIGAGLAALGLSAVVLLPFLEILPQTWQHHVRSAGIWGDRGVALVESLRRAVPSIVPYAWGVPGRGDVVDRLIVPPGYAGTLIVPFALAGLAGRARGRWLFFGLAAAGLAIDARLAIVAGPLGRLPLFDLAVNDYFIFLLPFGLAALAVLGAERLARGEGRTAFLAGTALTIAAVLGVAVVRAEGFAMLAVEPRYLFVRLAVGVAAPLAAAAVLRWRTRRGASAPATTLVLIAIFLAQRTWEESSVYPTYTRASYYPPLPVLDPIPRGEPVRMAAVRYTFPPNVATLYGVEDVRGYDAMTLRSYAETYPGWCRQLPASFNLIESVSPSWLSMLGVRYLLVPPGRPSPPGWPVVAEENGTRLAENPSALPRAFVPARVARVRPDRALETVLSIRDFALEGVVGDGTADTANWSGNGAARVSVSGYAPGRLALWVEAETPVFVGTSVTDWKGWKLEVDGRRAPLRAFNHAFLGFDVPAGRHAAVLRYLPDGFVAGAAISAVTAALLLILGLRRRSRAAPERATPRPA